MLDLGLIDYENLEKYDTKYLNELVQGDEIKGEIAVREFKNAPSQRRDVAEFYVVVTNRESHLKWVCEFAASYSPESDILFMEYGGLFYNFFDSLNHVINERPLNWRKNYQVNFSRFRNTVNHSISSITLKAVKTGEGAVNLVVVNAEIAAVTRKRSSLTIYDLAQKNSVILKAYTSLRNRGDRITIKNIQLQLKSSLDDGNINEDSYRAALDELKEVKPSAETL